MKESKRKFLKLLAAMGWAGAFGSKVHAQMIPFGFWKKKSGLTLWLWGENDVGQLGVGNLVNRSSPVQVPGGAVWAQASIGESHVLAIRTDGSLWSWGTNAFGELGLGDLVNRSTPCQVGSSKNWVQVRSNMAHSTAINSEGKLYIWGRNNTGQLGDGSIIDVSTPIQVGSETYWNTVRVGGGCTYATTNDGRMFVWGNNGSGRIGLGDNVHRSSPVQLGALTNWAYGDGGGSTGLWLKTDGTLWSCGNAFGGLPGQGSSYTAVSSPVKIGSATDWTFLAVGENHAVGLKAGGTLYGWGRNNTGALGLGDLSHRSDPTQIGASTWAEATSCGINNDNFSLFLNTNGTLWSSGINSVGQLGIGHTTTVSTMVQIGSDTDWVSVGACPSLS